MGASPSEMLARELSKKPSERGTLLKQLLTVQEDGEYRAAMHTEKKKILLIEDDLFISEMYKKQLEISGYEVDFAMGGGEGKRKIQEKKYDLVLLDIMLPGMSGLEILAEMKANPETAKTPVIILSNLDLQEVVDKGLSLGAEKYLTKATLTPLDLVSVVANSVNSKKA
ncbi:MAG TPA: response regulator [bacterium]|nr:response regulator [bacterium]